MNAGDSEVGRLTVIVRERGGLGALTSGVTDQFDGRQVGYEGSDLPLLMRLFAPLPRLTK